MKKIIHLDCPPGKSFIEAMATRLFDEMRARNKAAAMAELELKEWSATICMTIEIKLQ